MTPITYTLLVAIECVADSEADVRALGERMAQCARFRRDGGVTMGAATSCVLPGGLRALGQACRMTAMEAGG